MPVPGKTCKYYREPLIINYQEHFSNLSRNFSWIWRSEEHTSELQSLMRISYAVFCLKKLATFWGFCWSDNIYFSVLVRSCQTASIEDINFSIANRILDKSLILELASLKFMENSNNIIFTGFTRNGQILPCTSIGK